MPVLPHIETIHSCIANQLTGFYMRATLAFNGLKYFNEQRGQIHQKINEKDLFYFFLYTTQSKN